MLIDGREVAPGTVLRADLCVIGAGAAGITIAQELSGSGLDVLVLESGSFEADPATTALNGGEIVGTPLDPTNPLPLDETRLRYFGGTTNHWAGYCRPLEEVDFERRPWLGGSGWPFGLAELVPYYERAQEVVRLGPFRYDWQWWDENHDAGRPVVDTALVATRMLQVTRSPKFGDNYRADLAAARSVRICLWTNATRLALAPDGSRLTGVDVATLTGNTFSVEARAYVLATGGLEVPRLLLASNDVQPAGIGNGNDLVGRHFMEHLSVLGGDIVLTVDVEGSALYAARDYPRSEDGTGTEQVQALGAMLLTDAARRERELLAMELTFPFGGPVANTADAAPQPGELAPVDVAQMASAVTGGAGAAGTYAVARLLCEQAPNPDSRVTLVAERDALGMPRIALDWRPTRADRESILRSLALVAREIGRTGAGRAQVEVSGSAPTTLDDAAIAAAADFPVGVGYHHMGTARMSAEPARGVVDPTGRVHGVGNLYLAGSSVFPTGGSAPPTLTITALALRLADRLRNRVLR